VLVRVDWEGARGELRTMISLVRLRGRFEMLVVVRLYDLFFLISLFGSPGSPPIVRPQKGSIVRGSD
jgi:hypothetical protein